MRSVAREFNQSETTFVLPPTRPAASWRLRSFTPAGAEVGRRRPQRARRAGGGWPWLAASSSTPNARRRAAQEFEDLLPWQVKAGGMPEALPPGESRRCTARKSAALA